MSVGVGESVDGCVWCVGVGVGEGVDGCVWCVEIGRAHV